MTGENAPVRVPEGVKLPDGTRWEGHHVTLDRFEGPLDLLLFLVRERQIDIRDISISEITDQFIVHVKQLQAEWTREDPDQLDRIGDFLVMAAVLIQLKTHELLPRDPEVPQDESEMSKEDLLRLLEEYERFKAAAGGLEVMMKERAKIFLRSHPSLEPEQEEILKVDLTRLLEAFRVVLKRAPAAEVQRMAREPIPIEEMIVHIRGVLEAQGSCLFLELFPGSFTKDRVIATFLALLELMRSGTIGIVQDGPLGDIRLVKVDPAEAAAAEDGAAIEADVIDERPRLEPGASEAPEQAGTGPVPADDPAAPALEPEGETGAPVAPVAAPRRGDDPSLL